jgi:hypothetical protein
MKVTYELKGQEMRGQHICFLMIRSSDGVTIEIPAGVCPSNDHYPDESGFCIVCGELPKSLLRNA